MNFIVTKNSPEAPYRQIISGIEGQIALGELRANSPLPSISELAAELSVSPETVKKAYYFLKGKGVISAQRGVGFFVAAPSPAKQTRILMLLDRLDSYKVLIYNGLTDTLGAKADITILLHNQDLDAFEKLLDTTIGRYDYYLVAPHFKKVGGKFTRIAKAVSKIPNENLIILDRQIPLMGGHFGEIVQDFATDAGTCLMGMSDRIRKYAKVVLVYSSGSLYGSEIQDGIESALSRMGIQFEVCEEYKSSLLNLGVLFIVMGPTTSATTFSILRDCERMGLKLGVAVGLVTYNDDPANEFICGGISCMSSDFYKMGELAATMINEGKVQKLRNPFILKLRQSL